MKGVIIVPPQVDWQSPVRISDPSGSVLRFRNSDLAACSCPLRWHLETAMSGPGQKRTWRLDRLMSAVPPIADIPTLSAKCHKRNLDPFQVPDIGSAAQREIPIRNR